MTSGSVTLDRRSVSNVGPFGAPQTHGSLWQKYWTGSDYPKPARPHPPRLERPPYLTFTKSERRSLLVSIRANNRAAIEEYKENMRSYRTARAVSRARHQATPHDYSCQKQFYVDHLEKWEFVRRIPLDPPGYAPALCSVMTQVGGVNASYPWTSEMDFELISRLQTKVQGSDFNAGVFLSELGPTAELLYHTAEKLRRIDRAIKRRDWRGLRRELHIPKGKADSIRAARDAAKARLVVEYGFKPLISDLQSCAEMFAHMLHFPFSQSFRVRLKAAARVQAAAPGRVRNFEADSWNHGQLIAHLTEVNVPQLTGLTDMSSILWEKLPWSFVFDWFVPFGSWLSARSVAQSLKGTFVTTRFRGYRVKRFDLYTELPGVYSPVAGAGTSFRAMQVLVDRKVSTSIKVPPPRIVPLKEALSVKRALNALALITLGGTQREDTRPTRAGSHLFLDWDFISRQAYPSPRRRK